jgi:hypothetical protein
MTTNEFADLAMARVEPARPFETQVLYDPDGDCIEFLISNEGFFAERIDSLVTVYYGRESGEIVGSLIKGVRRIIASLSQKLPGFKIDVEDGRLRLEHLFTAQLWASPSAEPDVGVVYRKLRQAAERADAEADLCVAS